MNKEIENTKIEAIQTDDLKQKNVAFLEKLEKEKTSTKLNYYIWLSRLFIFVATASLIIFMSTSLSLFKLAPLVFVEPFLIVNQDNSEDIVRAEAMISKMSSKEKILEYFMRQYIILRNTIIPDQTEMATRWYPGGMINYFSGYKVYSEFSPNIKARVPKIVTDGISQSVIIDSLERVGGPKSPIWKANFRTFMLSPKNTEKEAGAMKLVTRYWTASISAKFYPGRILIARRLINPLGFTVIDYSQAQVNVF